MKIKVTRTGTNVQIFLEGRMDTASSQQTQDYINRELDKMGSFSQLTCNASGLTYISSSGLRILLSLRKRCANFMLTEVGPEVYRVLEMTGFTKMMTVERALRQISVDGCEEIGRGGVGIVYRIDDDTIIKVFREDTDLEEVKREITMAKEAFVLGMPTAISFDTVRVGRQYGLVYELLRAETLSACLCKQPDRIDEAARMFASLFRQLHGIHVLSGGVIPSAMEQEERAIHHISRYFDAESIDLLLRLLHAIPQGDRLLHCDLQPKNAMMQGPELMLIDMGEVCYGHPIIDLGHAYSAMVGFVGDYNQVIGIPREVGTDLWNRTMRYYFEGISEDEFTHRMAQIEVASRVRNFSWLALSDSFPEAVVRECQQLFTERVTKQRDYLLDISNTFVDWKLD